MFDEDDLLPLSGLQHMLFCERQWGLIHIEQQWEDNRLTAEGRILHDRVHDEGTEARPGVVIARGLPLRSSRLGLVGQADVVEFHRVDDGAAGAMRLPGREGLWRPFPVEYKRGRPKADACDQVQLCAQAMCLEEMLSVSIPAGAIFYGKTRRRLGVSCDENLRQETESVARKAHDLIASGITPPPVYEKRCESCSLMAECLPKTIQKNRPVKNYMTRILGEP